MHRPTLDDDTVERRVTARLARQGILGRCPAPALSFALEEVTLRRPVGDSMILRWQLERLLDIGRLRHVEIQVMPTGRDDNAGLGGSFELLATSDGPSMAHVEAQQLIGVLTQRKEVQALEARYGSSGHRHFRRRTHWRSSTKC